MRGPGAVKISSTSAKTTLAAWHSCWISGLRDWREPLWPLLVVVLLVLVMVVVVRLVLWCGQNP